MSRKRCKKDRVTTIAVNRLTPTPRARVTANPLTTLAPKAFPNQNKIGDYYTLVSDETGAHVVYAATFNGEQDVYYLRVFPAEPVPDIKANASDGPLVITTDQSCDVTISLDPGRLNGQPANGGYIYSRPMVTFHFLISRHH